MSLNGGEGRQPLKNAGSVFSEGGVGSFIAGTKIPDQPPLSLTTNGATMSLITLVIGAGVISLPSSIGGAGFIVGFFMVIFVGIIAIDSGRILCVAAQLAEEAGHTIQSFEDIGMAACGALGRNTTIWMMQVMYFLIASIFILLTGQYLGLIIDTAAGKNEDCCEGVLPLLEKLNGGVTGGWMLVGAIMLIPTLFMWDMSTVAKFAPAGIAGALVLIVCMFIGSFIVIANNGLAPASDFPEPNKFLPPSMGAVVSVFLKAVFSYSGVAAIPTMRPEMIEPEKLTGCVVRAMGFVTAVYVIVSIPGILAFGIPSEQLLAHVNQAFLYMGSAGIVVHVFIALPIILNVFFNTASLTVLPIMKTRNPVSILLRFVVLVLCFIVPLIFGSLGALLDLVSAVTMIGTMIFLPIIFYWALVAKKEGSFGKAISAIGSAAFVWQIVMLVVGGFAVVVGVVQGVNELQAAKPCPLPHPLSPAKLAECGNVMNSMQLLSNASASFVL